MITNKIKYKNHNLLKKIKECKSKKNGKEKKNDNSVILKCAFCFKYYITGQIISLILNVYITHTL